MFKRNHKIENLTARINNRDKLIEKQSETIKRYEEENADLRFKNEELRTVIRQINILLTSNTYENKEVIDKKIKELVADYQSLN